MHWPQYGRLRSHLTWRFLQAKQSSLAPVAGALLLRFLGAAEALVAVVVVLLVVSGFWASVAWVLDDDMAIVDNIQVWGREVEVKSGASAGSEIAV